MIELEELTRQIKELPPLPDVVAKLLQANGRREKAAPLFEQALAIFEASLGAEHPSTVTVRQNLEEFRAGGN